MMQPAYKAAFAGLMSFKHGHTYSSNTVFTREQLLDITADDVVAFMNQRAYGTPTPSETDKPTHIRSNTLEYWKKGISYFMPIKNHQWNEVTNTGNPTRSQSVNDMIKKVKRFEVRKQGKASQARRPLTTAEIKAVLQELRNSDSVEIKYGITALLCFQFHVIGRVDDCCKWYRSNLSSHDQYPGKAGRFRLAWSKNVTDERDAPWQHLFGCMDWVFCTILHVGLWLEIYHTIMPNAREGPFVFSFTSDTTSDHERIATKSKNRIYHILAPLLKEIGLEANNGPVGSHSIRKLAATFARLLGISKDDKDTRGRWKGRKRVSDVYDDVQLDYVDARVAAVLSPGGVCHYEVVDPGVTNDFIMQVVTPQIKEVFGVPLAILFGKAIMWLAFSPYQEHMPQDMRQRIESAYTERATIEHGENPIRRRLVTVTGDESNVFMEDVPATVEDGAEEQPNATGMAPPRVGDGHDGNRQLLLTIVSQIQGLKRTCTEQTNALEIMRGTLRRHDRTVNRLAKKIDNNPINLLQRASVNTRTAASPQRIHLTDDGCAPNAVLSSHPRTLNDLWREWMHGIGGNKAAKDFTSRERGRCKHKFCRRKVAWDAIQEQINAGKTASQACDDIYAAFGPNLSITQIINAIKRAKRRGEGMPPVLRIGQVVIPVPRPFPRVLLTSPLNPNRTGPGGRI